MEIVPDGVRSVCVGANQVALNQGNRCSRSQLDSEPVVPRDEVPGAFRGASDDVVRNTADSNAVAEVPDGNRAGHVDANVVSGNRVPRRGLVANQHAALAVAGDDIAGGRFRSTDDVVGRSADPNSKRRVSQSGRSRDIGPDEVALHEVGVGGGAGQFNADMIPGNHVAGARQNSPHRVARGSVLDSYGVEIAQIERSTNVGSDEVALDQVAGGGRGNHADAVNRAGGDYVAGGGRRSSDRVVGRSVDVHAGTVPHRGRTLNIRADEVALDNVSTERVEIDPNMKTVDGQSANDAVAGRDQASF